MKYASVSIEKINTKDNGRVPIVAPVLWYGTRSGSHIVVKHWGMGKGVSR